MLVYHSNNIAMLWFDLDDTLWDMSGNSVICLRELYDAHRLDRYFDSPQQWDAIYHEINHSLWDRYSRGEISRDFLRAERFSAPLRRVGVDPQLADSLSARFDGEYLARLGSKSALVDGARDLLDKLKSLGYRMGIVSNGFHEVQYNKLRSAAIYGYFDCVVLSDDAGVNKPDIRFFQYAERRASTAGRLNLIVGDNLDTDIRGALGAGWQTVWFNPEAKPVPDDIAHSVLSVTSLCRVADLF